MAVACVLTTPLAARAACPSEETIAGGYFLEGGTARSEIHHLGDRYVQATTRYPDGVEQTDLYVDGLFAISRTSSRGAQMMHGADFTDWRLDLSKGASATLRYTPVVNSQPKPEATVVLQVKGTEEIKLGACSYTVHVIALARRSGGNERRYEQLYSPLLKFVIGRRYPNGDVRAYRGIEAIP